MYDCGTRFGHSMDTKLPMQKNTSQETMRNLRHREIYESVLDPKEKPKVKNTDNSLEFGKACEDLQWNDCASKLHRPETNGVAERQQGESKKRVQLTSCSLDSTNGDLENISVGQSHLSEQQSSIIRYQRNIRRGSINSARKSSQAFVHGLRSVCGEEAGTETCSLQTLMNYRRKMLLNFKLKESNQKKLSCHMKETT